MSEPPGGALFEDLPDESALVDAPVPIRQGVASLIDSSAIEVETTAVPSAASATTIPVAGRPLAPVSTFTFTRENLASLGRRIEQNEKQIDLLAQQLKPLIAKSIVKAVAPTHKDVHILHSQIDSIRKWVNERAPEGVEKIGDHDPEGEFQTLIGVVGTTDAIIMEALPATPTLTPDTCA
ncbi:hypothetical protein HAX54_039340 [Datura stramonium]|uniref:Uncharacterized protein n=1 Tax=Datura stramonium TaxID=4076 RepID=A0ABS8VMH1_DATST|nr:hypothetical protein [Datura stramonium]